MNRNCFIKAPAILLLVIFFGLFPQDDSHSANNAGGYGFFTSGRLLVASSNSSDPHFQKSIVLMVAHSAEGAYGFIINKNLGDGPMDAFINGFGIETEDSLFQGKEVPLFFGGPVSTSSLFVIHSNDYQSSETERVTELFSVTHTDLILRDIVSGEGPESFIFVAGYAGWGSGQLDDEIERGDWTVAPATQSLIFDDDYDLKWERAMASSGLDL